ncbi:MAG: hypothetical protein HGA67_04560 [Candidatus Yonathbacteria bacterium]|nr:hypothetical protein [Candidatus Yonathbacteria bacterium]
MQENNKLGLGRIAIAKEYMPDKESYRLLFWVCIALGSMFFFLLSIHYHGGTMPFSDIYLIPIGFVIFWFALKLLCFSINLLTYKTLLRRKKEFAESRIVIANTLLDDIKRIYAAIKRIDADSPSVCDLVKGIERKLSSFEINSLSTLLEENSKGAGEQTKTLYRGVRNALGSINMPDILFDIATRSSTETPSAKDELKNRCQDATNSFVLFSAMAHAVLNDLIAKNKRLVEDIVL